MPHTDQDGSVPSPRTGPYALFARQVSLVVGVVIAALALMYFLAVIFRLLLFVFAGVLFAVFLRGSANWITRHTGLSLRASVPLVFALLIGAIVAMGWLMIPPLLEQVQTLADEIPRALRQIEESLEQYDWGRLILGALPQEPAGLFGDGEGDLLENLGMILASTLGGLLDFIVFIVVGMSTALTPQRYTAGIVRLVPVAHRGRAREVLRILGDQLQSWLVARFLTMVAVGVITAIGLWLLGVPMILVLSVLAGLFEFIPVVGPILSSVPAILIALLQSPMFAVYVALFYWGVQSLESYLISPVLHHQIVKLAPALVIIAELVMALTMGFIGLVMATPLLVVTIVLLRLLYLEDILGDEQGSLAGEA
jgi:predicted PurR-regulated permease PerM